VLQSVLNPIDADVKVAARNKALEPEALDPLRQLFDLVVLGVAPVPPSPAEFPSTTKPVPELAKLEGHLLSLTHEVWFFHGPLQEAALRAGLLF
jgi:hypothetical protein